MWPATKTRSGLLIAVVTIARDSGQERAAREHPKLVRLTHWLNAVSLTVLIMSGLQIFVAFPSFGAKIPQVDLLHVPEAVRLGGWLGGALQWHFTFAWLFTLTGAAYVAFLVATGHWRHVILRPHETPGVWPMVRHYFFFRPRPESREPYNPLQKLAYTAVIVCGAIAVATGLLLSKPVQLAPIVTLLGGFQAIRLYHFAAMVGFLAFIPGHLFMVALHGWTNFASMWTGWRRRPDYLDGQLRP